MRSLLGVAAIVATMVSVTTLGLLTQPARAQGPRTLPEVFALVVTNNRSGSVERPDLQYADDDGARYYQMFLSIAPAQRVHLLTRFDRATEALYPSLASSAQPPRLASVRSALADIERGVAEARRNGRRTQFYFVFAGHGDVDGSSGYLDLEDGRIDSNFLEYEVVQRVAADTQHIVLDSCNSFFVVNPRKPGGRRFATPRDMALGFARRHPSVGLFLSTNSEAEVYEWSELESGIFSHEVRSGLSGAADADGDGQITYTELAGFVDRANMRLPRENLRPRIFFRGPSGDGAAALFDLAPAEGRRLALGEGERRLWIRGAAGQRLIDLHKEQVPMTVLIPGPSDQPSSVVEWLPGARQGDRPSLREYQIAGGTENLSLSDLRAEAPASAPRGGAEMFGQLFSAPYGPAAFAAFVKENGAPSEEVYGISRADEERMRHYLTAIASSDHEILRAQRAWFVGLGLTLTGGAVAAYFSEPQSEGSPPVALIAGGVVGLALLGNGLRLALTTPPGERALEAFEEQTRLTPENRGLAVAKTESYLDELAQQEALTQRVMCGIFFTFAGLTAALTTVGAVTGEDGGRDPVALVLGYGVSASLAVSGVLMLDTEMPTARLLRLYRTDPDLRPHVNVSLLPGGAGLSLAGRF
jgi:hypothetical protein